MPLRFLDPYVRRSLALVAIVLSITGLVLTGGASPSFGRPATLEIAGDGEDRAPPPRERASATSAPFSGERIHGRFAISHGRLLANGRRPMFVEVRVGAEDGERATRAPLALVLAIDTSGSMAGQKIVDARRAALALLEEMRDDDAVAVVRFATDAELLVPLGTVSEARSRARRAIEGLVARGDTNIARAVRLGIDELASRGDRRVKRIALVTDGRDTSGAPRGTAAEVARREATRGVTLSALGIGLDYDDAYLADLASAGHGNYEYLRDGSALARFLSRELSEAARTTVERVTVDLALPQGARVRSVSGAAWETSREGARLTLGSLFAGDERRVLVSLDVDAGEAGTALTLGGSATWSPVGRDRVEASLPQLRVESVAAASEVDAARDLSVLASATSVSASQREREAAAAFQRGDQARALELNKQSREELAAVASAAPPADAARLRAQANAYGSDSKAFESPPSAAPAAARPIVVRESKNLDRSMAY